MIRNKIDLTKHMPQHPVLKTIAVVFATIGLLGLWGSLTHADLQIQSTINNVISTFKELHITTDGSPQGSTKVILSTGGIWVDTGALGGPEAGVIKATPQGYLTRGLISGENIAANTITGLHIQSGSITTGHLSFYLTGGSGSGSSTLTCGPGEAVIGVVGGVAQCAPIIGTGDCSSSGGVLGWSSTGQIICDVGGTVIGGGGGGYWHPSTVNPADIYYGTFIDDLNGNVAVGLDAPLAKLHVKGSFRVDTSGTVTAFSTGSSGSSIYIEVPGMKGFHPPYCNTGINCIHNSSFNPYINPPNLKAVEVMGSYVNVYDEDPGFPTYNWLYTTQYPRCSCDTNLSTVDCAPTNVSFHSDPYCVDVVDNGNDATWPGPGGIPMFPITPIPVQFYIYAGPANNIVPISNANPGLIAAAARVGINTLTPTAGLDIVGSVRFRSYMGAGLRNLGVDSNGYVVLMPYITPDPNPWQDGGGGTIHYLGGNVGINTMTPSTELDVMGDILATNYFIISDENLKTDITPIAGALSKVLQLSGYSFKWRGTERADMGVLAQEVEAVMPQLVKQNEGGFKSVEYANLIGVVIEAMKELNQRATMLSDEYRNAQNVADLYNKYIQNDGVLSELQTRVTDLENAQ